MVRSRETEIKVFGGEVESLAVAEADGVGVRLLVDGRQGIRVRGFARCATSSPRRVGRRTRQRGVRHGRTTRYGLADAGRRRRRRPARSRPLARRRCSRTPTEAKVALAVEADRAVLAADARVRGVESTDYGDAAVEVAMVASSLGVRGVDPAHVVLGVERSRWPASGERDPDRLRLLGRPDVRRPRRRPAWRRWRRSASTRLLGARQPASRRLPVVFDPLVTRVGARAARRARSAARRCSRAARCSRTASGEAIAAPRRDARRRPHERPRRSARRPIDGEGVPTRAGRRSSRDGVLLGFLHNVYTAAPQPARRRPARRCAASSRRRRSVPARCTSRRAPRPPAEVLASVPEALYVQSVSAACTRARTR